MRKITVEREAALSPKALYDVISYVERYPEFIRYIKGVEVLNDAGSGFRARVRIGFGPIVFSYLSSVTLEPGKRVSVTAERGVFRNLYVDWRFASATRGRAALTYHTAFSLHGLADGVVALAMGVIMRRTLAAMEARAVALAPAI